MTGAGGTEAGGPPGPAWMQMSRMPHCVQQLGAGNIPAALPGRRRQQSTGPLAVQPAEMRRCWPPLLPLEAPRSAAAGGVVVWRAATAVASTRCCCSGLALGATDWR